MLLLPSSRGILSYLIPLPAVYIWLKNYFLYQRLIVRNKHTWPQILSHMWMLNLLDIIHWSMGKIEILNLKLLWEKIISSHWGPSWCRHRQLLSMRSPLWRRPDKIVSTSMQIIVCWTEGIFLEKYWTYQKPVLSLSGGLFLVVPALGFSLGKEEELDDLHKNQMIVYPLFLGTLSPHRWE